MRLLAWNSTHEATTLEQRLRTWPAEDLQDAKEFNLCEHLAISDSTYINYDRLIEDQTIEPHLFTAAIRIATAPNFQPRSTAHGD